MESSLRFNNLLDFKSKILLIRLTVISESINRNLSIDKVAPAAHSESDGELFIMNSRKLLHRVRKISNNNVMMC